VQFFTLTLHGNGGILYRTECGETEFVIGQEAAPDVFTVSDASVAQRHAMLWVGSQKLQVEPLEGETLVNGYTIKERVEVDYPASVQTGDVTLLIEPIDGGGQLQAGAAGVSGVRVAIDASSAGRSFSGSGRLETASEHAAHQGTYRIAGEIARGGMGCIYTGLDDQLGRKVAIKISTISQDGVDPRLNREAEVLAHLAHPNIVPVYNRGCDDAGRPFYAMKLVKGRSLQDILNLIREGDPAAVSEYPTPALLTMFRKVCDAMAFAHSKQILNRDLKPDNVMVGEYGEVLVMDWGLAKRMSSGMHDEHLSDAAPRDPEPALEMPSPGLREFQTLNGLIVGTPPYIAPEAARGELDLISPKSDIYVLGSILYAILTLRPPYPGKEFGELIEQIVSGKFEHPSSFNQSPKGSTGSGDNIAYVLAHLPGRRVPEGLAAIVLKAMAYDAADRYEKVEDLQDDITAWQNGFAPKAERAGLRKQITLWAARHKDKVALIAFFAVVFHVAVGWFFFSIHNARKAAEKNAEIARQRGDQLAIALADLEGTGPVFFSQAKELAKQKEFDKALDKIDAAIRQLPNNADYHYQRGNYLQTLLRLDDAEDSYQRVIDINPNHPGAKENLALTQKILAEENEDHELEPRHIRELEKAMIDQKRITEASVVAAKSGLEPGKFFRELRAAMDANPELRPLRELISDRREIKGRFVKQGDGTWTANFRDVPPATYMPLLRSGVVRISSLVLDGANIPDLAALSSLKELRSLSLNGCRGLNDLTPLAGLPIRSLNLARSDVADLAPLASLPLAELRLDGCNRIRDLRPITQIKTLRSLTLPVPRGQGEIAVLRSMTSLELLGFKDPPVPAEQFWKQVETRGK